MSTATSYSTRGSVATTAGVRVEVEPEYVAEQSDPGTGKYVFAYRIRITNTDCDGEGRNGPVQLLTRHWRIVDAHGREEIVEGEGVVGRRPTLEPGEVFEYSSWCPLRTRWGTMEGWYGFRREDGGKFDVPIARFFLVSSAERRS